LTVPEQKKMLISSFILFAWPNINALILPPDLQATIHCFSQDHSTTISSSLSTLWNYYRLCN